MKCPSTGVFPKRAIAFAITSAMLMQTHSSFAEGETENSGTSYLTDTQVLHWLSQPENHDNARIMEHSSDEDKTKIVIEISNTEKGISPAALAHNMTIPSANTAIPLAELPTAENDDELVKLPANLPEAGLTAGPDELAQPLDADEYLNIAHAINQSYPIDQAHPVNLVHPHFHPMMLVAIPPDREIIETEPYTQRAQLSRYATTRVNGGEAELAPAISPHAVHNAHLAMQTAGNTLDERMSGQRTGIDKGHGLSDQGLWIQYSYNKATQDVRDAVPGYQAKTNGFTIGADSALEYNPDIRTGIAYTFAKGRVYGENGSNGRINTDTNIFSLYTSSWEDDYFFDGRLSYAFGKNHGQRIVANNRLDASYHAKTWGIGLSGGYHVELTDSWYWQPKVAFNYYSIDIDDYSEAARNPAQTFLTFDQVNNGRYNILELGGGMSLLTDFFVADNTVIRPELGIMAFHDFKKDPIDVTAHFAAGGENFLIHGAQRTRNRYQAEATVNLNMLDNTVFVLSYAHHWASQFKADSFIAKVRYEF